MVRVRSLPSAVAVAVGLALSPQPADADDPLAVLRIDDPGPRVPPAGRSVFDELFATSDGHEVPFPFDRLLARLDARLAPEHALTALFPLGRSLQRFAAHPDYFASPRIVVAVAEDGSAGTVTDPRLADRLFLGYQPAAEAIEVISYNEEAGRFEFQEVTDYRAGATPAVDYATREFCIGCHQGHGPIFSRPLWSESNANSAIAARLAGLGQEFHGAPVHQGIDRLDDFDRSTDRANRIAVANRLWDEGCGPGNEGTACRAALLGEVLRYRLSGARVEWRPRDLAAASWLHRRVVRLWPGGLALPAPDLPNRDPLRALASVTDIAEVLDTSGSFDPETVRPGLVLWTPAPAAADTYDAVVRMLAPMFADADIAWLDTRLASLAVAVPALSVACRVSRLPGGDGRRELRFDCGAEPDGARLAGFIVADGSRVGAGRIDEVSIAGAGTVRLLALDGGRIAIEGDAFDIAAMPREAGAGLSARLPSGLRIDTLHIDGRGGIAVATLALADDIPALDAALLRLAATVAPSLGPGPLRRRALLADIDRALRDDEKALQ